MTGEMGAMIYLRCKKLLNRSCRFGSKADIAHHSGQRFVFGWPPAISPVAGASTRQQIGELFELGDLGPQQLAGFADPQPAWMER